MVDLHCHILPGIDDGPRTMTEALALAQAQVEAGTSTVVATPHVHWDYPMNSARRICRHVAALRGALDAADIALEVRAGAECALTRAVDLEDDELEELRLGDSPWLLVECPFSGASTSFEAALGSLARRGYRILLAHPERIVGFSNDRELLRRLIRGGMAGQLTAGSLAGRFGKEVQRFSWWLLEERLVHLVASDAHSVDRRPPGMASPLQAVGLDAAWIEYLVVQTPADLLAGDALGTPPAGPVRAKRLSNLLRRAS